MTECTRLKATQPRFSFRLFSIGRFTGGAGGRKNDDPAEIKYQCHYKITE